MKVLFVCHGNVGRSQVAQACFAKMSQHESESAGIGVDENIAILNSPSRKLKDVGSQRSVNYIRKEFGLEYAEKERQQLTPAIIDRSDLVIVIEEKHKWPDYLEENDKIVCWDIPDAGGRDDDFVYDVFRQVQLRAQQLVKEIG